MNDKSRKRKHLPGITIDPNMPDFSKDPFVIRKAEQARAFLVKHPIPDDLLKKRKNK